MIDYAILYAESNEAMANEVRAYLAEGWEPQGGVLMGGGLGTVDLGPMGGFTNQPYTSFFQAMIKREPRE